MKKVDEEQVDVDIQFIHLHGPLKTFNWPQGGNSCYVPMKKNCLCYSGTYYNHMKNLQNL